jgi:hypothetical protein
MHGEGSHIEHGPSAGDRGPHATLGFTGAAALDRVGSPIDCSELARSREHGEADPIA